MELDFEIDKITESIENSHMIAIYTNEKLNWFLNGIENGEIIIDSRKMTKEEREDMRKEIAEYKVMHNNKKVKEAVLA